MHWADLDGDGRAELIVVAADGPRHRGPDVRRGRGVRTLRYKIPADPDEADRGSPR